MKKKNLSENPENPENTAGTPAGNDPGNTAGAVSETGSETPAPAGGGHGRFYLAMLKIGLIGFGGGNALVPVMQRETAAKGLVPEEEFEKDVIVANITPGALPVELASGLGRTVGGWKGMVAAAVLMALPGAVLVQLLLTFFTSAGETVMRCIQFASIGITGLILFLLGSYALQTADTGRRFSREWVVSICLVLATFCVTNGSAINTLFDIDTVPVFSVSALDVLGLAFFAIFFAQGRFNRRNLPVIAVVGILYLLSVGDAEVISVSWMPALLRTIMVVLGAWGLLASIRRSRIGFKNFPWKRMLRESGVWIGFVLLLCLPALILYKPARSFVLNACLSAVMSFGGGDAYIAIAKGLFVGTGMITEAAFYSQIVTVSNAVPGSILCKMLTGIGFTIGQDISAAATLWISLAGFACGVGVSGLTFLLMHYAYDCLESLDIFQAIKQYFRPVIGGLLLTVAVSMLNTSITAGAAYGISLAVVLNLTILTVILIAFLRNVKDRGLFTCIVTAAAISLAVCSIVYFY